MDDCWHQNHLTDPEMIRGNGLSGDQEAQFNPNFLISENFKKKLIPADYKRHVCLHNKASNSRCSPWSRTDCRWPTSMPNVLLTLFHQKSPGWTAIWKCKFISPVLNQQLPFCITDTSNWIRSSSANNVFSLKQMILPLSYLKTYFFKTDDQLGMCYRVKSAQKSELESRRW